MTTATLPRPEIHVSRATPADVGCSWAETVLATEQSHLAHAPEWFTAIPSAYGHDPLYLSAQDAEGRRAVLPAFVVRRPVIGTVISSMPFLDGGGPCAPSGALGDALVARLIEEGGRVGAAAVEVRCAQRLALASEPMEHKVNLTLPLPDDPERLWKQLDGSVRSRVRRAERRGLSVEFGGAEKLDDFYAIYVTRMHELGSPAHARRFFTAVFDAFGRRARVALVRLGGVPVGGLIALAFKDVLGVPWVSCLSQHFKLFPNMLLYWAALRAGCEEGFRTFDFGRSSRGSGTHRFKQQWGATEQTLFWYTIPLGRASARPPARDSGRAAFFVRSWRHLPLPVTRTLGPHIRKYLTQ